MRPELLLPAGDIEKLKTAFQYGADAVYAGVPAFSLRTKEVRFSIEGVRQAVEYTKKLGKKIYLTLNIFPHNYKIPALKKALRPLAELQPDAFIAADPGVIMLCKEIAPDVPLHLSVQANNVNWASARFWHEQGVERIILSREISLPEIREIHERNPGLELEFFVHGSVCMAYSGRCLLSNYLSYRDANQGTCSHVCRWEYNVYKARSKYEVPDEEAYDKGYRELDADYYLEEVNRPGLYFQIDEDPNGTYLMNAKDLCLIEYLKELKEAGICSFKIEGRNKTVYYAANTAKIYRKAIDEMEAGKPFNPEHIRELAKASNRGFIPGFIVNNPREKAQEYEKNYTRQTHEFAGVIRDIHKFDGETWYETEVKGRLDAPAKVEVMTPSRDFECVIKSFKKLTGETLTVVHPGQKDRVLIRLPEEVEVGAMLRKERETLRRKPATPVKRIGGLLNGAADKRSGALAGQAARGPRSLKVESACKCVNVQDLAGKK